jgi:glycosyltransferase involved in cell wall biosynthesis
MHGAMTEPEKRDLYRDQRVVSLLMPTRGEGYGLPVLEAALLGLPIIAPSHSGYLDFAADLITPVDFRLVSVPRSRIDGQVFVDACAWAEVDGDSCKAAMRRAIEGPTATREVNNSIAERLSIDAVTKALTERYGKKTDLYR